MPRPRRVLAIDDSEITLAAVKLALEGAGFEVDTAVDLESFSLLRAAGPHDCLVVDVQMPEAYGDDLAAMLLGGQGERAPVVLFSSLPEDELARRAAEAGVAAHVSKTDGVAALVSKVRDLLGDA